MASISQSLTPFGNLYPRDYPFWRNSNSSNSVGVVISIPRWRTNALGSSKNLLIRAEKKPIKKLRIHNGIKTTNHSIIFSTSPEEVARRSEFLK